MRTLLLGLTLSLPVVASAGSPASAYDDYSYPSDRAREVTVVQHVQRAPNPYDDAGMNGQELDAATSATETAETRAATRSEAPCRCSAPRAVVPDVPYDDPAYTFDDEIGSTAARSRSVDGAPDVEDRSLPRAAR